MRTPTLTALAATTAALLALTGCGTDDKPAAEDTSAASAPAELPKDARESIARGAGIPPRPTGTQRTELLTALTAVNPGIGVNEDKAIDAARNQCSAINGGANRLDWLAGQRFSYRGNTVTEAQGKQLNAALKKSGFCKV